MLNRNEIEQYALDICLPLMERTLKRKNRGVYSYKPDQVGYIPAFLESFCRPFWGIAPIIADGRAVNIKDGSGEISVFEYFRKTLSDGLDDNSDLKWEDFYEYFNPFVYENQNITELAGLMIGVFFAREQLWEPLKDEEKQLFADKMYKMAEAAFDHSWPNNHYWFPLFTFTVLKRLGYCYDRTDEMLREGLEFLDSLYLGDGWYQDGSFGRFDYYQAWSLHMYPLLWTLIADETFEDYAQKKAAYIERTNKFIDFYTHWFAKDGAMVPFGRSLSYRFAAASLFPVAVLAGCDIDPALAGRITAKNIEYFKNNYRSEDEILHEGYMYPAPGVVEGYTSDGGAYWCCKTFLALLIPEDSDFWKYDKAVMPAEAEDFIVKPMHKSINMPFASYKGQVVMYNNTSQHPQDFGNMPCWYGKFAYSSAGGFGCSVPNKVSLDSMIGLMTPDGTMTSHRWAYEDLGYDKNGALHSKHVPYANDSGSYIETWMLPLDGMHIRVHKVKLSQPYYVMEGGFSLGRYDDYAPFKVEENMAIFENKKYKSWMRAVSNTEIVLEKGETQSGHHMYAPLGAYPMYKTAEPLEAGEYIFAGVYGICDADEDIKFTKFGLYGNIIELEWADKIVKLEI